MSNTKNRSTWGLSKSINMLTKIGLAVKSINIFQQLTREENLQMQILTHEDISQLGSADFTLDIIIWQPEFSRGEFPAGLQNYFLRNQDTMLIVYNADKTKYQMPQFLKNGMVTIVDIPLTKYALKQLLLKAVQTRHTRLIHDVDKLTSDPDDDLKVFGTSSAVKQINEFINLISKSANTHCLLQGETGTEKTEVARLIHKKSINSGFPIQIMNCANGSSEELLVKLFGMESNERDGRRTHPGILEVFDEGTVVLENIELIDEEIQNRLETYIETHSFRRVGSDQDLKTKTRIIATTAFDLERFVTDEKFSKDLYFRFKAFELTIPPLRSRKDDIIPLAKSFISYFNDKFGHHVQGINPEIEQKLHSYDWPGNYYELRLLIEHAVLLTRKGEITFAAFPDDSSFKKETINDLNILGNCSLQEMERLHISKVLIRMKGNKSKAAELLGISRTTLREKMRLFMLT
jgi:DNA-binding NtrC family response regulator